MTTIELHLPDGRPLATRIEDIAAVIKAAEKQPFLETDQKSFVFIRDAGGHFVQETYEHVKELLEGE